MPKKKSQHRPSLFHADAKRRSLVVRPKIEPHEPEESDAVLWREMASDSFAPDKPDKETRQIMSYKETHRRKRASTRWKGKAS